VTDRPTGGATIEIGQHFDMDTGLAQPSAQFDSRQLIPATSPLLSRRFVRVRIRFDLSLVGTPAQLFNSFAPSGGVNVPIADDPGTTEIENTLGNTDTAPEGVPAVAEVRVQFTP
jgi:hypothetical protein